MKFFTILFLLPIVLFSQTKMDKISFLNNKIEIVVPSDLMKMSDDMWKKKNNTTPKPLLVLVDASGEVNLQASIVPRIIKETQVMDFKQFQLNNFKENRPDVKVLSEGFKIVDNRKVGYIKFKSKVVDQNIFNYYFFVLDTDKMIFFSFNCVERVQSTWEDTADNIVNSLKINK